MTQQLLGANTYMYVAVVNVKDACDLMTVVSVQSVLIRKNLVDLEGKKRHVNIKKCSKKTNCQSVQDTPSSLFDKNGKHGSNTHCIWSSSKLY